MSIGLFDRRANMVGRVAAVVGGAGGIGRACALDLARAGVALALVDRDEALLDECVGIAEAEDVVVLAMCGDARDPDVLHRWFDSIDVRFGRLDILVNVVGGTFRQRFRESTPNGWDALMRTNFTWILHSTQAAVPLMRRHESGSIINVTSLEAHRAAPGYAVYAAMKAAVTSLSRTLAVELAPEGIRVNTVAPEFIRTEGSASHFAEIDAGTEAAEGEAAALRIAIPMGRVGTYEDVGSCVLFLASDMSRYITGNTLHPDGGSFAALGWLNWPGSGFSSFPPAAVAAHAVTVGAVG